MPNWKEEIKRRLASLNLLPMREAEIVEELAQHLDDRYDELRGNGSSESVAFCSVLVELSDSDLLRHELLV